MSHFCFLQREWPDIFEAATKVEAVVHSDPRTACFYSRRALELAVAWVYKHDPSLRLPYQDNLSALFHVAYWLAHTYGRVERQARIPCHRHQQVRHQKGRAVAEADKLPPP